MAELFDNMCNANSLYRAYELSKRESNWKCSVQRFGASVFTNIRELQNELRSNSYAQKPFVEFTLHERGKDRRIKSVHIRDRVVQRSLCDEVLTKCLTKYLVYDNGASLEGKGIDFTRKRLQCHLEKYIRRHGVSGYILKIDFSKFFDNIDHGMAVKAVAEKIDDPSAMALYEYLISTFEIPMSEEDFIKYRYEPFNSLKFSGGGSRRLKRSVGIGAQISQNTGIFYPTRIDTLCKTVLGCTYYGRYMDDIYVIHENKEFLITVREEIKKIAKEMGLFVNERKTNITALKHGFTFMQVKYSFTEAGKIIKRLSSATFSRERRRLNKYRNLIGKCMTREDISNAYQSWKGSMKRYKTHRSVRAMDKIYNQLFVDN